MNWKNFWLALAVGSVAICALFGVAELVYRLEKLMYPGFGAHLICGGVLLAYAVAVGLAGERKQ